MGKEQTVHCSTGLEWGYPFEVVIFKRQTDVYTLAYTPHSVSQEDLEAVTHQSSGHFQPHGLPSHCQPLLKGTKGPCRTG